MAEKRRKLQKISGGDNLTPAEHGIVGSTYLPLQEMLEKLRNPLTYDEAIDALRIPLGLQSDERRDRPFPEALVWIAGNRREACMQGVFSLFPRSTTLALYAEKQVVRIRIPGVMYRDGRTKPLFFRVQVIQKPKDTDRGEEEENVVGGSVLSSLSLRVRSEGEEPGMVDYFVLEDAIHADRRIGPYRILRIKTPQEAEQT